MLDSEGTAVEFVVVVNSEGQHSVWDAERDVPLGWELEGFAGSREECLVHIEAVWTDITPKSARRTVGGKDA